MKKSYQYLIASLLIAFIILSREYSPLANFTAVGAVALFAGFLMGRIRGITIVVAGMFISDLFFEGLHDLGVMITVYSAFIACVFIGSARWSTGLRNRNLDRLITVFSKGIVSGTIFYLISNLGVWLFAGMYSLSLTGLIECYTMALPFFRFTWLGDVSFALLLFGNYYIIADRVEATAKSIIIKG